MAFFLSYEFYLVYGIQAIGDVWAQAQLHVAADGIPVQGPTLSMIGSAWNLIWLFKPMERKQSFY